MHCFVLFTIADHTVLILCIARLIYMSLLLCSYVAQGKESDPGYWSDRSKNGVPIANCGMQFND
jgi:hypothetical protein